MDHKHTKTSNQTRVDLIELGMPLPDKPEDQDLKWPSNVGDLELNELALHLTYWSGWSSYARFNLAKADTDYKALQEAYDFKFKKYAFQSRSDHKTVTEAKGAFMTLKDTQELKQVLLKAEALKVALDALLEGYEKKYSTISREISRRSNDFSQYNTKRSM